MDDRYVTWREWASVQISIAMLEERVKTVQQDQRRLRDRLDYHERMPPPSTTRTDWKWWGQIMIAMILIAFLLLANVNETLALAILATIREVIAR